MAATLTCIDPYITLYQTGATYGDMPTGSTAVNTAEPFVVAADAGAPDGHLAEFTVTSTFGDGEVNSDFVLVIGDFHYLVWDPSPDESSGPVIATTLAALGYNGSYTNELPVTDLDHYQTLWISVGIYSSNYIIPAGSQEALSIINYLNEGGCAYMEGGDVWYFDPGVGGHSFNSTFGLAAVSDGTSDCGPVRGMAGAFTEGMYFNYVGENDWIDHLMASGAYSTLILENVSPVYGLGVAQDNGTYKTVGTSFEFEGLADGTYPSTKARLAQAIMDFFLDTSTAVEDGPVALVHDGLAAWPNPFNPVTTLRFVNPAAGPVSLAIYDCSGRLVRSLADGKEPQGELEYVWDGRDRNGRAVATGVYFARAQGAEFSSTSKLALLK